MICPNCGKENPGEGSFCVYCGTSLMGEVLDPTPNENLAETEMIGAGTPAGQASGYGYGYGSPSSASQTDDVNIVRVKPSGGGRKWLKILLICLIILALLATGAFAVHKILGSDKNKKETAEEKDDGGEGQEPAEDEEEPEPEGNQTAIAAGAAEHNGHYYLVVDDPMYWKDAKTACEKKGGHLATITSKDEQSFIQTLIEDNGEKMNYWLGGTDEKKEGSWQWITGEEWGFTKWRNNQPDNRNNDDEDGDQNYLQICCGSKEGDRYMSWYDMCNSGHSEGYEDYPNYKETKHTGYICEWDE